MLKKKINKTILMLGKIGIALLCKIRKTENLNYKLVVGGNPKAKGLLFEVTSIVSYFFINQWVKILHKLIYSADYVCQYKEVINENKGDLQYLLKK